MSILAHGTVLAHSASFSQEIVDDSEGSPPVDSNDPISGATDSEQKAIDEYRASEARVVDLAVQTLDPKDMLKKYARLGAEALKLAQKRKGSFKAWAKEDFEKVCTDLETLVKMRVAIKDIRIGVYVRVHLWVEAVKAVVPNVEKLSYFQVANKFLPTLQFDPVELTGEIRKDWLTWVRTSVERQLGEEPMSIKDLDQSIADQKKEIERAKTAKKDPEKLLEQERKALETKSKKERRDGQNKIVESLDAAITNGHADVSDVVQIVDQVLKSNNLSLPAKVVGFDPAHCTVTDCKTLAAAMAGAGKLAEMKVLRDTLDAMIKIAEHAMLRAAS
jgi:hypothetical protein